MLETMMTASSTSSSVPSSLSSSARVAKTAGVLVLLLACLGGCSRDKSASMAKPASASVVAPSGGEALPNADRSLVVTMDVSITVDRVEPAMAKLQAAVRDAGGYVADSHMNGTDAGASDRDQSAHLELRVPADKAGNVRASFDGLGEVTSASEKVEDVTEQRADIEARLHSARIQEKRLLDILDQKATNVADLVAAEKELARVRENIERLEAQDRTMKSNIRLATIRVNLSSKSTPAWQTPGTSLYHAGKTGVRGAAAISVYVAMAFCTVAPTLLPIAGLLFGVYMIARRRRRALPPCADGLSG